MQPCSENPGWVPSLQEAPVSGKLLFMVFQSPSGRDFKSFQFKGQCEVMGGQRAYVSIIIKRRNKHLIKPKVELTALSRHREKTQTEGPMEVQAMRSASFL